MNNQINPVRHTDINATGWIARMPPCMRPYLLLMRLDRPIGTWLLLLPGWWAIVLAAGGGMSLGRAEIWLLFLFGIGAVIMRGAGCVVNDLWDRNLDRGVERTRARPLAAGDVSVRRALMFLCVLMLAGFVILLQMNAAAIVLGVLSVVLIAVYPLMKRITWWPQAFLGLTFNFGALIGWAAVTDGIGAPAIFLYAAGFFWTLGYDTIYATQDMEDDMRMGIRSTALRLGAAAKRWVAGFYGVVLLLLVAALLAGGAGMWAYGAMVLAAGQLFLQWRGWSDGDPAIKQASALRAFRSNRDFGLLVLLAVALAGL